MLPLSVKIAWVFLTSVGTLTSWVVMYALAQTVGTFWIPMAYATFLTVIEASVGIGEYYFTFFVTKLSNAASRYDLDHGSNGHAESILSWCVDFTVHCDYC